MEGVGSIAYLKKDEASRLYFKGLDKKKPPYSLERQGG